MKLSAPKWSLTMSRAALMAVMLLPINAAAIDEAASADGPASERIGLKELEDFKAECLKYESDFFSYNQSGPSEVFEGTLQYKWSDVKRSYIKGVDYHRPPSCLEDGDCEVKDLEALQEWQANANQGFNEVFNFIDVNFNDMVEATNSYIDARRRYKRMQVTRREGVLLYSFCAGSRYMLEVKQQLQSAAAVVPKLEEEQRALIAEQKRQEALRQQREAERKARLEREAEQARLAELRKEQEAKRIAAETETFYANLKSQLGADDEAVVLVKSGTAGSRWYFDVDDYPSLVQLALHDVVGTGNGSSKATSQLSAYKEAITSASQPLRLSRFAYDSEQGLFNVAVKAGRFELQQGIALDPELIADAQLARETAQALEQAVKSEAGEVWVALQISDDRQLLTLRDAAIVVFDDKEPEASEVVPLMLEPLQVNISAQAVNANYRQLVAERKQERERQRQRELAAQRRHAAEYPYYAEISCEVGHGGSVSMQACLADGGDIQVTTKSGTESYGIVDVYRLEDRRGVVKIDLPAVFNIRVQNGSDADYMRSRLVVKETIGDVQVKTLSVTGSYKTMQLTSQ
ncbi:cell envelope integrity protein TolA [Pseudidiomarina homiensis]|uniref:cell envelope integrity protein TolA n=1 Tax=Pseudidiomarina homiensis TaxID=364198 RepID=UPI00215AF550|nr:cell envelope integrity protein TolA [Pseudidiomarina homiensis]